MHINSEKNTKINATQKMTRKINFFHAKKLEKVSNHINKTGKSFAIYH